MHLVRLRPPRNRIPNRHRLNKFTDTIIHAAISFVYQDKFPVKFKLTIKPNVTTKLSMKRFFESLFLCGTGYTYSNMARLFIRLFVGVMLLQFGIRHLINFSVLRTTFPQVLGMGSEAALIVMICIEVICSLCIMVGFLTRLSLIPPFVAMIIAEYHILHDLMPDTYIYTISSTQPGYLPLMFIGIYLFLALAGPGKISLDYFISLYIVSTRGKDDTQTAELEEV